MFRENNAKQVRQFLGLVGFFRKLIKDFAKRVVPLTNLLRKNVTWKWGSVQETSVWEIKEILSSRPVILNFDPSLETEVHTDASSMELVAMLIQKFDNMNHVVAYYSRKTSPEEQRYHSYNLETLAIVEALKKFRVYVLGIKFNVTRVVFRTAEETHRAVVYTFVIFNNSKSVCTVMC